jgi:hypothetical protein
MDCSDFTWICFMVVDSVGFWLDRGNFPSDGVNMSIKMVGNPPMCITLHEQENVLRAIVHSAA